MQNIVEAIREGEIVRVPESQAREEELFILRRISEAVRDESPAPQQAAIAPRLIDPTAKYKTGMRRDIPRIETWRKAPYKRNNVLAELKENFHWEIIRKRRGLGMTRKQFADKLGETEEKLKIVENGGLPEDNFSMIIKIERALNLDLRKDKARSEVTLAELQNLGEEKMRGEIDKAHGVVHGTGTEKSRVREAIERVKSGKEKDAGVGSIFGDDIQLIE